MKKFTRVLSIVLSVVMVFSMIAVSAACGPKPKPVTVTYYDKSVVFDSYTVTTGKLIPADKVAQDPVPDADKVFLFWSEDGTTNYIATGKPTTDINLFSVYRNREPGEIVVTFDTNGGKPHVPMQIVSAGGKVAKPGEVKLAGGKFNMWREQGASDAFDFDTKQIYNDTVIEASWDEGDGKVLVLSSGNFDKVFSPFFATSAYDSEVAGVTQISMLTSNANGEVYVGEDVPTVVKSYTEKTYVGGVEDKDGSLVADLDPSALKDSSKCKTVYEFVIKNNIQFSDGKPLTIKDVLFNLYVYLDPVYTGASTVYSTNIIGLAAYRTQDPQAVDGGKVDDSFATAMANERLQNLRQYYSTDPSRINGYRTAIEKNSTEHKQVFEDLQRLRMYYYKELLSDWNNYSVIEDVKEDYKEYGFTEPWQVFLLNNGIITAEYDSTGKVKTIDNIPLEEGGTPMVEYGETWSYVHTAEYLVPYVFNTNLGILTAEEIGSDYKVGSDVPKTGLIFNADGIIDEGANLAAIGSFPADVNNKTATSLIARASNGSAIDNKFRSTVNYVSRYRSSGQDLYSYIKAVATAEYLKSQNPGSDDLLVPNIKGITAHNNGTNDVLRIEIVGVDPKAIWNFGFSVAPMHYYSDPSTKTGFSAEKYGYTHFTYPGVDGVAANSTTYNLGFQQCDLNYFQGVINHSSVQGVPVGAGTFKASNNSGKSTSSLSEFCDNNVVNLRRNDFFETTGNDINNAKFEYLKYKVVDTSKMVDALKSGDVHYGDPGATDINISSVQSTSNLEKELVDNNGFGYIGVNAKHVPVLEIRQAIMTAIDTALILQYYGDNAEIIHFPMSKESWAYPDETVDAYPYVNKDTAKQTIIDLVGDAGFEKSLKNSKGAWGKDHTALGKIYLEYEFVVAGTSTEHPAYAAFTNAAAILNDSDVGFKITVKNDAFALSKLSNGGLAIWAAAWSAGIDPDMYQVYHYQSTASSIKNWGFAEILQYGTKAESDNVKRLATLIEEGRQTTDQDIRKGTYKNALETLMKLAVEYPTYQRKNMFVYDKTKIDKDSLNQNPTPHAGLLSRLWEVKLLR